MTIAADTRAARAPSAFEAKLAVTRLALTNFRKAKTLAPDSVVVANNLQLLANTATSRA